MTRQYGSISFAKELAGQEPAIKFAALAGLHEYFRESRLNLSREQFWSLVEEYQNVTDGIQTATNAEIFRFALPSHHRGQIESLGFSVGPIAAANSNDF